VQGHESPWGSGVQGRALGSQQASRPGCRHHV
jgi:hypothetical protein